jgi:hypothetical protein
MLYVSHEGNDAEDHTNLMNHLFVQVLQPESLAHHQLAAILPPKNVGKASYPPWITSIAKVNTIEEDMRRKLLASSGQLDEEVQEPTTNRVFWLGYVQPLGSLESDKQER